MNTEEKRALIKKAVTYKSGQDSCNTVYMGGIAQAGLCDALGIRFMDDDILKGIKYATDEQIDTAYHRCEGIIEYMLKNPVTNCPCCGQIVTATMELNMEYAE